MKTILVPLDGSVLAEEALPYARLYAQLYGARVELIKVIADVEARFVADAVRERTAEGSEQHQPMSVRIEHALAAQRRYAEEYLTGQAALFEAEGISVQVTVATGHPAEAILAAATSEDTLIVIATHGHTGLRRWTLGSVTEKVVQHAHGPVLVIRSRGAATTSELRLERILVPLDLSAHSAAALPVAADLAGRVPQADLLVLHADVPLAYLYAGPYMPAVEFEATRRQEAVAELTNLTDQYRTASVRTEVITCTGYPAESIIAEARHHAVNLIVMATHGWSGFGRWVLGSTASKVLEGTHTPLLLVRPPAHLKTVEAVTQAVASI